MNTVTRILLAIAVISSITITLAGVLVFAETRHSRELSDIARSEAEKRYIIEWWLSSTGMDIKYNVSRIEDITPEKASTILNEDIYKGDMGLLIGGIQFRFLKYTGTGVEQITSDDIVKVFMAIANARNTKLSCENVLGKAFYHIMAGLRKHPETCRYTINDIDETISIILGIALENNIDIEYFSSVIAKFYALKTAINRGILREIYDKILDELLMKESLLLAFMFKSMADELRVIVVEEIGIGDVLRSIISDGDKSAVSEIDLDLLLKTITELTREIQGKNIDMSRLPAIVEIVLREGIDPGVIEKLLSLVKEAKDEGSLIVAISGVFERGIPVQVQNEAVLSNNTEIERYMGSSISGVDHRRIYEERYGIQPIDHDQGEFDAIHSEKVNSEIDSPYNVVDAEMALENAFQKLLDRVNNELLNLNIIKTDKASSSNKVDSRTRSPRVLTSREMNIAEYVSTALGSAMLISYVLIYRRNDLVNLAKYLAKLMRGVRLLLDSHVKYTGSADIGVFDKRSVFLHKFWNSLIKISSRHGVEISVSTTHREAYRSLVARGVDPWISAVLWKLVLGYEKIRYSNVFEDLDLDELIKIAESL
ncbi:MAG: hypothetical protein QXQ17_04685 [Desulfurococcaceae archaeon]